MFNRSALLDQVDVSIHGSQFTLYNANDGAIFVNTSNSKGTFHSEWNQTNHQQQTSGLNLPNILKQLDIVGRQMLDDEKSRGSVGGKSFIALIIPQMAGVNAADGNFAVERIVNMREVIPDLQIIFWSGGAHGRFEQFVRDPQRDLFPLMAGTSNSDNNQQVQAVSKRIQSGIIYC